MPSVRRQDDRLATQIRALESFQSQLSRADGSAKFSFGGKCGVMCSVVGPAEVRLHKDELLDKAAISVNFKSLVGMTSTRERMYERLLRDTAEHLIHSKQFPRTNIQIVVQVVADDGCVLSAAMNAMVLALIDAGIPLRGMAGSISCCVDHQGEILLDPTSAELNDAISTHMFVFDSQSWGIIASDSIGNIATPDAYFICYDLCKAAAERIVVFSRLSIERKLSKTFNLQ